MNKIKYDSDLIKLITMFESLSGAKVKDCIANDKLIFVVEEGEMGKAIGRNGINIKRMESQLKKNIKLVEFNNDAVQFLKNLIYPQEAQKIEHDNKVITIYGKDTGSKARLIGRERQNINFLSSIIKRYFDIDEIKVA